MRRRIMIWMQLAFVATLAYSAMITVPRGAPPADAPPAMDATCTVLFWVNLAASLFVALDAAMQYDRRAITRRTAVCEAVAAAALAGASFFAVLPMMT